MIQNIAHTIISLAILSKTVSYWNSIVGSYLYHWLSQSIGELGHNKRNPTWGNDLEAFMNEELADPDWEWTMFERNGA